MKPPERSVGRFCFYVRWISEKRMSTPLAQVLESGEELHHVSWHSHNLSANRGGARMKFRPLHDRVVVRRLEQEEKTAGGIIIPDTAKEKPQEGEVVAVGPGARDEKGTLQPLDLKAGDRVLFGKWSGTEVKIDGEELMIMKESDVMGIIEGKPAKAKKVA
jgi:chaperonin GroES